MKRPGEAAAIYFDGVAQVDVGDYMRTPSGRTYLITGVRVQQRGKHTGRQHLATVVMDPDHQPEPDATVHGIAWYTRRKSTRGRR